MTPVIQSTLFLSGLALFMAVALVALVFVTRVKKTVRQIGLWLTLVASSLFLTLALSVFIGGQTFSITVYQITSLLQFSFVVDPVAALFIGIIALVSISVCLYSLRYTERHGSDSSKNLLVAMMALFILSMLLLVASDNTFSFLFFWEIMSMTSFFLVMSERDKKETPKSGLFYFIMTQMSTVFLMFAFLAIYRVTGTFEIERVTGIPASLQTAIFLSLFVGFSIKAGVMPFHKWLPYAHSASPSNISALMSGVMIKVAIYGMVRYIVFVFSPPRWWGILILVFGTFSALLGVIYALKEHDIKKLLAYHSIENIGIILIGFGLYIIFNTYGFPELALLGLLGGLFHTLNHALFKSLLFLTAGAVVDATGTRNIEKMGGLIKTMPYTGILFLTGSIAIAALPPLNGFVSELMIFEAFLQSFIITSPFLKILLFLGLSLFALTSALAAACFVKAFGIIFLATPRSEEARQAREVPGYMIAGSLVLAICCVLAGVFSFQLFALLGFNLPIPNLMIVGMLLLIALALVWLVMKLAANRGKRISETWGCGVLSQTGRTEYTASGFSEPILTIFRPIYRTNKVVERNFSDTGNAIFRSGAAEIRTFKIFEEKIYLPVAHFVRWLSALVSNAQDVDLDTYILYSFAAIVILLFAMGWII